MSQVSEIVQLQPTAKAVHNVGCLRLPYLDGGRGQQLTPVSQALLLSEAPRVRRCFMSTYSFLYKVPGDSTVHEMEVVSCSFLVAAEKFREVVENRYRSFDLVQAYGPGGAPLYLGNPQEQFRDQFDARMGVSS